MFALIRFGLRNYLMSDDLSAFHCNKDDDSGCDEFIHKETKQSSTT
jgi:hypothetical protein